MIRIYSASNNAEADVLRSVLTAHGIPATVQGYQHRSLLGMLGSYIQLDVLVPETDETEARSLIDELQEPEAAAPQTAAKISQRRPAVAVMLALLFPGMGSLYVGRKRLGAWLAAGSALCFTTLYLQTHAGPSHHFLYAALGLLGLMGGDLASVLAYRYRKRPQLVVISG